MPHCKAAAERQGRVTGKDGGPWGKGGPGVGASDSYRAGHKLCMGQCF